MQRLFKAQTGGETMAVERKIEEKKEKKRKAPS